MDDVITVGGDPVFSALILMIGLELCSSHYICTHTHTHTYKHTHTQTHTHTRTHIHLEAFPERFTKVLSNLVHPDAAHGSDGQGSN